jgi:hypothetical protein
LAGHIAFCPENSETPHRPQAIRLAHHAESCHAAKAVQALPTSIDRQGTRCADAAVKKQKQHDEASYA